MVSAYKEFISLIPALSKDKNFGKWITDDHEGNLVIPFVAYSGAAGQMGYAIDRFVDKHPEINASELLEKHHIKMTESGLMKADVNKLDANTIMACLMWVRQSERFCDGLLLEFLQKGTILKWLKRLKELEQ